MGKGQFRGLWLIITNRTLYKTRTESKKNEKNGGMKSKQIQGIRVKD